MKKNNKGNRISKKPDSVSIKKVMRGDKTKKRTTTNKSPVKKSVKTASDPIGGRFKKDNDCKK